MNKKVFGIKLVVFVLIAVILQGVLSVVYILNLKSSSYIQYEDYSLMSVTDILYKVQRDIDDSLDEANNTLNYSDITDGLSVGDFDFIFTQYKDDKDNLITKYVSATEMNEPVLKSTYIDKLNGETPYLLASSSDLFENAENKLMIVVNTINNVGNHIWYCKSIQRESDMLIKTGFEGVIFSRSDSVALYSNLSKYNYTNIVKSLPFTIERDKKSYVTQSIVDGDTKTIAIVSMGDEYQNMYVLAFMSSQKVADYVNATSYRFVCIVIALLLISVITLILSILLFVKDYKNITVFTGFYPKNYVAIYGKKKGNLIYENKAFTKEFGKVDVLKSICVDGDIKLFLTKRESFPVKLIDKTNKARYVNFIIKNGTSTYKFIGGESTELMERFYTYKISNETEAVTGLKNQELLRHDYNEYDNGLFIVIRVFRYNRITNMFGFDFSKKLLRAFSDRLNLEFKDLGDTYYYGYYRFVVLVQGNKQKQVLDQMEKIMDSLNGPIKINDNIVQLETRAGVVNIDKGNSIDKTLEGGDSAAESSKDLERVKYSLFHFNEKNYINFFDPDLIKHMEQEKSLAVYFQPQLDLKTNKIVGFEALTRILNKTVNIGKFISEIENKGFMMKLGDFIYNQAFLFAKSIEKFGVTVSVNISGVQFMQTGFIDYFLSKIKEFNVNPELLCIEVTESFLLGNIDETIKKLSILKSHGIQIHLDDFGIAYSSLLYFKKLPSDLIKFDREFVKDLQENETSRIVLVNLISMCKEAGKKTIAEGVEVTKQKTFLTNIGCDQIQGFIIGRAMPGEDAINLIKKYNKVDDDGNPIGNPFKKFAKGIADKKNSEVKVSDANEKKEVVNSEEKKEVNFDSILEKGTENNSDKGGQNE